MFLDECKLGVLLIRYLRALRPKYLLFCQNGFTKQVRGCVNRIQCTTRKDMPFYPSFTSTTFYCKDKEIASHRETILQ